MSEQLKELVEKINALYAKATPGEWKAWGNEACGYGGIDIPHLRRSVFGGQHAQQPADAALCAALHNDWPTIATALQSLMEEKEMLGQGSPPAEGHGALCYYCAKPCNAFAGNPRDWPIPLCHEDEPGKVKWHHIRCVSSRLRRLSHAEAVVRELVEHEEYAAITYRETASRSSAVFDSKRRWQSARTFLAEQQQPGDSASADVGGISSTDGFIPQI